MTEGDLSIGPLKPDEDSAWQQMRQKLWPECTPERHALERLFAERSGSAVFIARRDSEPLGFIELSTRHDHVNGSENYPVPYVEGWFVEESARGRGIGQALMQQAEEWARQRGFTELASDEEIENQLSIRKHLALGFREVARDVSFIKKLR